MSKLELIEEIRLPEDELQLANWPLGLAIVLEKVGLPAHVVVVIGLGVPPREEDASEEQEFSESLIMEWVAIMKSDGSDICEPANIFDLVCTWTYLSLATYRQKN